MARLREAIWEMPHVGARAAQQARLQMPGCGPWPACSARLTAARSRRLTANIVFHNFDSSPCIDSFWFFLIGSGFLFTLTVREIRGENLGRQGCLIIANFLKQCFLVTRFQFRQVVALDLFAVRLEFATD